MTRASIIIPTRANLAWLQPCLDSLYPSLSKDDEVLLVINGRTEEEVQPTAAYAEARAAIAPIPTRVLRSEVGFCAAVNAGLAAAAGKYLIMLNDDTLLQHRWLEDLIATLHVAEETHPDAKIGLAGPTSVNVMPAQELRVAEASDPTQVEAVAHRLRQLEKQPLFHPTSSLSGFCLLMTRSCYEAIGGLDIDTFGIGGFCDNDLCIRARDAGYRAIIAARTFIYHAGSKTLERYEPQQRGGLANRERFVRKYRARHRPQTLCAMYRVKIDTDVDMALFCRSIRRSAELADCMVILDDRSTYDIRKGIERLPLPPGFLRIYSRNKEDEGFNEFRDQNRLLAAARSTGMDWLLSLDHDEILDEAATKESLQRMLNPINPQVECYVLPSYTFWRGESHVRVDDLWGNMAYAALFRNLPQGAITQPGTSIVHCRKPPQLVPQNAAHVTNALQIRHYGYANYDKAVEKRAWYDTTDQVKDRRLIGRADYDHLTSEFPLLLIPYHRPTVTLTLMVKNELQELVRVIYEIADWVDDVLVCHTANDPQIVDFCHTMGIRLIRYQCCEKYAEPGHWLCDFAAARNATIEEVKTEYILFLDPDESINREGLTFLPKILMENRDAYMCEIHNLQRPEFHANGQRPKIFQTLQPRLFRKHPLLKYRGKIHESLEDVIREHEEITCSPTPILIQHYGFLQQPMGSADRTEKNEAYAQHLIALLKDNPNDAKSLYALGQHLNSELRQFDEGDQMLARALEIEPKFYNCRSELAFRLMKRAYNLLTEAPRESIPTKEKEQILQAVTRDLHKWVGQLPW